MKLLLVIILGYLVGSIPFALVIGKVFYKTDVRQYGSGNLGGGNTGRVLGKKAGLATMALDLLKVSFVILFARLIGGNDTVTAAGALAAGIGHCFPLFAGFKGGKAVAAMYGYLFGLFAFAGRSPTYFFLPLVVFLIVIILTRIISLSSIISAVIVTIYVCTRPESMPIKIVQIIFALLIIIRHRSNIVRLVNHSENKVTWVPKLYTLYSKRSFLSHLLLTGKIFFYLKHIGALLCAGIGIPFLWEIQLNRVFMLRLHGRKIRRQDSKKYGRQHIGYTDFFAPDQVDPDTEDQNGADQ